MTKYLLCFLMCFGSLFVQAQLYHEQTTNLPVYHNWDQAEALKFAWAGGVNNPQFSATDLNNDGLEDLFVFDRADGTVLTLINGGTPNTFDYSLDLNYAKEFPLMYEWALIEDFNCDGIGDLFTADNVGVTIYEGSFNSDNQLVFELVVESLATMEGIPIEVDVKDYPAIVDLENDGHLDILTFNPSGGQVFYFRNEATECGLFEMALVDSCWGSFYETLDKEVTLDCDCECMGYFADQEEEEYRVGVHAGSALLSADFNGDGLNELVLGDLNSNNLVKLDNGGTLEDGYVVNQDIAFPVYDEPADFRSFLSSFYVDVDNDGIRDLIAGANNVNNMSPYNNVWFYKNIGSDNSATFELQKMNFLLDEMLDVGLYSHPVFFDHNSDGLEDIVVGNRTKINLPFGGTSVDVSSLSLFENVGTAEEPAFVYVTDDYLNLSDLQWKDFVPAFGDINGDGAKDLVLGTTGPASPTGDFDGTLIYLENTGLAGENEAASFGSPVFLYQDIDVYQNSAPYFYDVNQDELLDLIIGNRLGQVWYFENQGTAESPSFIQINNFWGKVDVKGTSGSGHAVPAVLADGTDRYLMVGAESGQIFQFHIAEDSLETGGFELVTKKYSEIETGIFLSPQFGDLNNDGMPELIVGNKRGGVMFFEMDTPPMTTTTVLPQESHLVEVAPNPAHDYLTLQWHTQKSEKVVVRLFDIQGKMMYEKAHDFSKSPLKIETITWSSGLYIINVKGETERWTEKVTIEH